MKSKMFVAIALAVFLVFVFNVIPASGQQIGQPPEQLQYLSPDDVHFYAIGWWDYVAQYSYQIPGVEGKNRVYDVSLPYGINTEVTEFICVVFKPLPGYYDFIELGWIKRTWLGVTYIHFVSSYCLDGYYSGERHYGDAQPGTWHKYRIEYEKKVGDLYHWYLYIDDSYVDYAPSRWAGGWVKAEAESHYRLSELTGHFTELKYKRPYPLGWFYWDKIATLFWPQYWIRTLSTYEFKTGGPVYGENYGSNSGVRLFAGMSVMDKYFEAVSCEYFIWTTPIPPTYITYYYNGIYLCKYSDPLYSYLIGEKSWSGTSTYIEDTNGPFSCPDWADGDIYYLRIYIWVKFTREPKSRQIWINLYDDGTYQVITYP